MNKNKIAFIVVLTAVVFITGCTRTTENDVIEIRERMFMTQIQDIYLNVNDFLGKTIKLEGIFSDIFWNGNNYYYVVRYVTDDCCGNDSVGFEVMWPQGSAGQIPGNNSWVEATGVMKVSAGGFHQPFYLELTSLNVLNTRGQEFISR